MNLFAGLRRLHEAGFGTLERATAEWLPGLAARFVFAGVLFGYFWKAALTKIGDGPLGFLTLSDGAWVQILPGMMEAAGYDTGRIATFPWGMIVALGTYAEFVLPTLIVVGLLTRLASLGMIVFILVQSWVDIAFHAPDERTVGALFDRFPGSAIMDQRTLWLFLLLYLVLKGPGAISLDAILSRRRKA